MSGKLSKDYINAFGKPPLSPYLSGETPTDTAAVAQSTSSQLNREIKGPNDETWAEPSTVTPSRSMNTVVFQSKQGGNSVVVNDDGDGEGGYMLITHNSGSVVQINANGTVLIKSFGDTHNNTEGIHHMHSKGDTKMNVGGSWDVRVDRGAHNVYVNGDVNVECENYALTARGKISLNAGEAIELKGAKYSMEAHTDNLDLIAKNIKIGTTESLTILSNKDIYLSAQEQLSLISIGMTYMMANSDINVLTTGEGDLYIKTAEKMTTDVGTEYSLNVAETMTTAVAEDYSLDVEGKIITDVTDLYSLNVGAKYDVNVTTAIKMTANTTMDLKAIGVAKLDGSQVRLGETTTSASTTEVLTVDEEEAAEAPQGAIPFTVELTDPPARRPSDASEQGISAVQPTPDGITSDTIDDLE